MPEWEVIQADCRDAMVDMPADSIDAIVTDPPYGLSFMGKGWDHAVPGEEFWSEALRVAKPGAHMLAFGGTRLYHRLTCAIEDAGWEVRDCLMWLYGSGFPKSHNLKDDRQGWGTALKPAWEPIILARKPLSGTVAANVTEHGTGALNIDGCRVGTTKQVPGGLSHNKSNVTYNGGWGVEDPSVHTGHMPNVGRWPANLILDAEAGAAVDGQAGDRGGGFGVRGGNRQLGYGFGPQGEVGYGDSGGPSRFFYCPKASKADRGPDNNHPTVKPHDLMRYLCRLITPPGGTVLDPFCGSGSTGKAAVAEGFDFVGIEMSNEYADIARDRIAAAASKAEHRQPELI